MDCSHFGACCLDECPPVRQDDSVPFELVHQDLQCMKSGVGACVGLDPHTRRCKLYEQRPYTCTTFSVGSPFCHLTRLWARLELDWFTDAPRLPKPGSFKTFCQMAVFGDGMHIMSVPGYETEHARRCIGEYNKLINR